MRLLMVLLLIAGCADPVAADALAGEDDAGTVTPPPDGGSACPRGDGTYCGGSIGRGSNHLYTCTAGTYVETGRCEGFGLCVVSQSGAHDKCGCLNGDGVYCGSAVGLDAHTLYQCSAGTYTPTLSCGAAECLVLPPGQGDSCPCPGGGSLFCGGDVGRDARTVYSCSQGNFLSVETCAGGCQAGTCRSCPEGDGTYCGGNGFDGDPDTLYRCTNGQFTPAQQCSVSCDAAESGPHDACAPCPDGDGDYCGEAVGGDDHVLYHCAGGTLTVKQTCPGQCYRNAPDAPDSCAGCPDGDGLFCGGAVGGDGQVLYRCADGALTAVQQCAGPCQPGGGGAEDHCPASNACTSLGRAALDWEAHQLAIGNSYSDYCLAFVYQAYRYGAGLIIGDLQAPAAVDAWHNMQRDGRAHPWTGSAPPCGAIMFWEANSCNGGYGHVAISNGDGTLSTSGWPGFGGSPRVTTDWMDRMDCGHLPAGWVDSP